MNKTLVRRYLGYFIIIALAVTVISVYSASLIRRQAYNRTVDILDGTNTAAKNIIEYVNPDDVGVFIEKIVIADVRITVIRADGVVIADTRADVSELDNHARRPEVHAALNGVRKISRRYSDSVGEDLVYVALPVIETAAGSVVIRSSMSIAKIDQSLRDTLRNIAIISVVTFLALSLLSYLSERRLIAPFSDIQKAAEAYSVGDLDHYLSIPAPEDARIVAEALNSMAGSLKSQITEVTDQRNELDAVFAGMTEAVVVLDDELSIRQLNKSAMRIVAPGITDPVGHSLVEVFRNLDLQKLAEETKGSEETTEGIIIFNGSLDLHFQVHGTRIPASDKTPSGIAIILVMTDITRMQHLETMRSDFVANVSHELKTPITNVKGFLETLHEGALHDPDAAERFLSIAMRNANRLNSILDDLLSLSRLEHQGDEELETEVRKVDGIIAAAVQACSPRAREKGIKLSVDGDTSLLARMNIQLIEQAFVNLIDNAVKYSEEHGEVIVKISDDHGMTNVSVIDRGVGIPKIDLPRIFERFYRVDKARSRELGGTGLGLAIVKHIALIHGGSVYVDSELGSGSTFTMLLRSS